MRPNERRLADVRRLTRQPLMEVQPLCATSAVLSLGFIWILDVSKSGGMMPRTLLLLKLRRVARLKD
jgi:hypothetical protein